MTDHKGSLLTILYDLDAKEFRKFKWHLLNEEVIQKAKLDEADMEQTVDEMVQTYKGDKVLEVMKTVLEKIQRNDLVEKISNSGSVSDSKGASATQAMTKLQEDKSASEKLRSRRNVFIHGISGANMNLLLDELLVQKVINDAEMESVRGERLTTEKAREIVDMVRKKGNMPCSKMIDIIGQLDAALGDRLNEPLPADQTDRPTAGPSGMTPNRFTGVESTQKPPEMNRMHESESKVHVHIHNTVSASNERSGMPLPTLANILAVNSGMTKKQVKCAVKRMENKGMLVQNKSNGTPSYKVAMGKKSVKKPVAKQPAAKKPANKPVANKQAAKKPTAKKPVANKPAAKKPAANKPATKKPATKKPAAKKPVANKSAVKKSSAKISKKVSKIPKKATKKSTATKPAKTKAVKPKKATSKK